MQRKLLPTGVITLLCSLMMLFSCNNENRQNNLDGQGGQQNPGGAIKFDTARAAQSVIPISQAIAFQRSFIGTRNDLKKLTKDTTYLTKNFSLPNAEAFSKDAILLLLSQKDADGIRLYYGKDSKGLIRLVLLPIRKDGSVIYNKLIPSIRSASDSSLSKVISAAEAVETGQTCPPCLLDLQIQQ